jgi:hypothetical protein
MMSKRCRPRDAHACRAPRSAGRRHLHVSGVTRPCGSSGALELPPCQGRVNSVCCISMSEITWRHPVSECAGLGHAGVFGGTTFQSSRSPLLETPVWYVSVGVLLFWKLKELGLLLLLIPNVILSRKTSGPSRSPCRPPSVMSRREFRYTGTEQSRSKTGISSKRAQPIRS